MTEKTNEIVEKELTIAFASYDESEQKITILASPEDDAPSSLTIRLQEYDEDTKKYVKSDEAYEAGLERLAKTGLTLEDIKTHQYIGKTFNAYCMDGKITFHKPQRFITANQIQNRESIQLDGLEVVTAAISDQKGKHRFRVVFEAPIKVKGKDEPENLGFLVSQLIFDDKEDLDTAPRGIGLKYSNKEILDFEKQLEDGKDILTDPVKKTIGDFLENAISRSRENKVEELKRLFDLDIEEAIEKGYQLRLIIKTIQIPASNNFFAQGEIVEIIKPEEE